MTLTTQEKADALRKDIAITKGLIDHPDTDDIQDVLARTNDAQRRMLDLIAPSEPDAIVDALIGDDGPSPTMPGHSAASWSRFLGLLNVALSNGGVADTTIETVSAIAQAVMDREFGGDYGSAIGQELAAQQVAIRAEGWHAGRLSMVGELGDALVRDGRESVAVASHEVAVRVYSRTEADVKAEQQRHRPKPRPQTG